MYIIYIIYNIYYILLYILYIILYMIYYIYHIIYIIYLSISIYLSIYISIYIYIFGAYFKEIIRGIKRPGIGCFIKKCPFWKKNFFLTSLKSVKNKFQLGIRPPPVLLDYPSAHLSNKGALLLKQRILFQEQFDSVLDFKWTVSEFFIFFDWSKYHIFCTSILW